MCIFSVAFLELIWNPNHNAEHSIHSSRPLREFDKRSSESIADTTYTVHTREHTPLCDIHSYSYHDNPLRAIVFWYLFYDFHGTHRDVSEFVLFTTIGEPDHVIRIHSLALCEWILFDFDVLTVECVCNDEERRAYCRWLFLPEHWIDRDLD